MARLKPRPFKALGFSAACLAPGRFLLASICPISTTPQSNPAPTNPAPTPQSNPAPTARPIPAWGETPCSASPETRGLKARPINSSGTDPITYLLHSRPVPNRCQALPLTTIFIFVPQPTIHQSLNPISASNNSWQGVMLNLLELR